MKAFILSFGIAGNILCSVAFAMVGAVWLFGPYTIGNITFGFTDHAWGWTGFYPWFERWLELPSITAIWIGTNVLLRIAWKAECERIDKLSNRHGTVRA